MPRTLGPHYPVACDIFRCLFLSALVDKETASSNDNAEQSIVSWFEIHSVTGLHDGHQNTSLHHSGFVIGINRHQH